MANPPRDPLTSLRRSIASNNPPTPTTSPDAASSESATDNLGVATHLHFTNPEPHTFSLDTPTRFISSDNPVDLRSIYFAWQQKDVNIPVYIASAQKLSDELGSSDRAGSKVQNLVFAERLDLITWLEGASDESEYIKGLDSDTSAAKSAQVASGALGGVSTVPSGAAGARSGKQIDPRLQEIYNLERKMGDRNSVLRGIKPTASFLCLECSFQWTLILPCTGLLQYTQTLRTVFQRSQEASYRRSFGHRYYILGVQRQEAWPSTRSHHLTFALSFIPAAHEQYQIFSRIRHIHSTRLQPCRLLSYGQHLTCLTSTPIDRQSTTFSLYSCRYPRAVQARLLESCRCRVHNWTDMAVQELQMAKCARFV